MSESELLLEDVSWVYEKNGKREAVLAVSKNESRKAGGADLLVGERCVEIVALFCSKDSALE